MDTIIISLLSKDMIVSGYNSCWALMCLGTNVSGHSHVRAQSCGRNHVWAQTCLGTNVSEPNLSGHSHVVTVVWPQSLYWNKRGGTYYDRRIKNMQSSTFFDLGKVLCGIWIPGQHTVWPLKSQHAWRYFFNESSLTWDIYWGLHSPWIRIPSSLGWNRNKSHKIWLCSDGRAKRVWLPRAPLQSLPLDPSSGGFWATAKIWLELITNQRVILLGFNNYTAIIQPKQMPKTTKHG